MKASKVLFAKPWKRTTENSQCPECYRQYVAYFKNQPKCSFCLTPEERLKLIPLGRQKTDNTARFNKGSRECTKYKKKSNVGQN